MVKQIKKEKNYPFGYDPATAFGNTELIERLKKATRGKTKGPCPECEGAAHLLDEFRRIRPCPTCKGKGQV